MYENTVNYKEKKTSSTLLPKKNHFFEKLYLYYYFLKSFRFDYRRLDIKIYVKPVLILGA